MWEDSFVRFAAPGMGKREKEREFLRKGSLCFGVCKCDGGGNPESMSICGEWTVNHGLLCDPDAEA